MATTNLGFGTQQQSYQGEQAGSYWNGKNYIQNFQGAAPQGYYYDTTGNLARGANPAGTSGTGTIGNSGTTGTNGSGALQQNADGTYSTINSNGGTQALGGDLMSRIQAQLVSDKVNPDGSGINANYINSLASRLGVSTDQIGAAFGKTPGQSSAWLQANGGTGQGVDSQLGAGGIPNNSAQAPIAQANLTGQYGSMGANDPSAANAQLLSGQVNRQYLDPLAASITQQSNRNLQENVLPGIGQGAEMAGGYGGSRMGIAQGKAIGDANLGLTNSLANMYGGAFENAQNRQAGAASNLSGIGASTAMGNAQMANGGNQFNSGQTNSYNLGMGNLGLGYTTANNNYDLGLRSNDLGNSTLDANINQNNFNNNLAGGYFGLNAYNALTGSNTNATNTAGNAQNTAMNYYNNFNNAANNAAGGGQNTNTNQSGTGNQLSGALGGAILGNAAYQEWLRSQTGGSSNLGFGVGGSGNPG